MQVLALGYSVGRVEEMPVVTHSKAAAGGKLLQRKLVKIYTPGTAVDGLMSDDLGHDPRPFITLVELTGSKDGVSGQTCIGCCVVDVATCQIHVGRIKDMSSRPQLNLALLRFDPVEVVAVRNTLSAATLTAVNTHCKSGIGSSGAGSLRGLQGLESAGSSTSVALTLLPKTSMSGRDAVEQLLLQHVPEGILR